MYKVHYKIKCPSKIRISFGVEDTSRVEGKNACLKPFIKLQCKKAIPPWPSACTALQLGKCSKLLMLFLGIKGLSKYYTHDIAV